MRAKCKKDGQLASKNELSRNIFYWSQLSCGVPGRDIFHVAGQCDQSLRAAVGVTLCAYNCLQLA